MSQQGASTTPDWRDVVDRWEYHSDPVLGVVEHCVNDYWDRFIRPKQGVRILVALSGGSDSVAMTAIMCRMAAQHDWVIAAAHVDYGLRGMESNSDHAFCRQLATLWNIPFHSVRVQAEEDTVEGGLQCWAREKRYRYFAKLAGTYGYDWIAVGHHVEDRAETVAAAVLNAAGSFALSGIPPLRGNIMRPLFECRRDDLRTMLKLLRIPWRDDSSNQSAIYRRNRIRQSILPHWELENPSIVPGLARAGLQLWEQRRYLESLAERLVEDALCDEGPARLVLDAEAMARYDSALDPFVLRALLYRLGLAEVPTPPVVGQFAELRQFEGGPKRCVEQGEWRATRSKNLIAVESRRASTSTESVVTPKRERMMFEWNGLQLRMELCHKMSTGRTDDRLEAWMDWNSVGEHLTLSHPQYGDRYRPLGLNGTKKLADLLADRGIPVFRRRETPVLSDAQGILWPIGHPVAERVRVTSSTKDILHARVIES